jgi:hypothetical protein
MDDKERVVISLMLLAVSMIQFLLGMWDFFLAGKSRLVLHAL